jgi:anthranilate synthase component 1
MEKHMKYKLNTHHRKLLVDTITPVNMYLKIRDKFPNSILLESSDYGVNDNSVAYICFHSIADIKLQKQTLHYRYPDGSSREKSLATNEKVAKHISDFAKEFDGDFSGGRFVSNGLFGFTSYEAVQYFEDITLTKKEEDVDIPDMYYALFQNVIAINVFNNEAHLYAHCYNTPNNLDEVISILQSCNLPSHKFRRNGDAFSNLTDDEFVSLVEKGIQHCYRGDVFQIVLSRRFSQPFLGDNFTLYRVLRSVNPSPYLFYFDFGNYQIFGSSPEAQLIVKDGKAEIHPIAGTFRRTGNDEQDAERARELAKDQKENSEHVMLVDLARNDLSRNGNQVRVEKNREVQFYSHVIHLVSKVTGMKKSDRSTMEIVADTFPAGTLSGAPKHRAMQLIEDYENRSRAFYGGAIGFMDFDGNYNHAIIIRSFLSKNNVLHYQAGAGVVSESKPKNELQEVYNKLGALQKALEEAEKL